MFHYEGTKASEPICICIWCLLCNDIFKKMLLKISLTYPLGIVKIFMVSHLGRNCVLLIFVFLVMNRIQGTWLNIYTIMNICRVKMQAHVDSISKSHLETGLPL